MLTFRGWACAICSRRDLAIAERRQFSGEPDAGNLLVRFDEGRGRLPSSPTLLVQKFLLISFLILRLTFTFYSPILKA